MIYVFEVKVQEKKDEKNQNRYLNVIANKLMR